MSDLYKIAARISVEGNALGWFTAFNKEIVGAHAKIKELEGSLASINRTKLAVGGAIAMAAGFGIAKLGEDLLKHGAKLEHFKAQAMGAGYSIAQQADIAAAAWKNAAANMNASVSESYKNILELSQVTGDLGDAIKMLPAFTKVETALSSLKDEGLRGSLGGKSQSYNFARSLELLGVTTDEAKLSSYTAGMTREMIGMRGLVDGSSFMTAINNAGGARYGWNEDFVEQSLGPLIQATKGRIGNQLYQMDRSYGSGVSTLMMARGAEKYGLWNQTDEVYDDKHFKGMKVGSIFEYDKLRANPVEWGGDVIEKLKKQGVDTADTNAMAKVIQEISRGNKNLGAGLDEILLPGPRNQLMKERQNIGRVPGDASDVLQAHDPMLAVKAFQTQWDNLLTALGSPLVETATNALKEMTAALVPITQWAAAHPEAVKVIGEGVAILGAALIGAGGVAILAALGPAGWIAAGVLGLGGVIAANHETIAGFLDWLTGWIGRIGKLVGAGGSPIGMGGVSPGGGGASIGAEVGAGMPGGKDAAPIADIPFGSPMSGGGGGAGFYVPGVGWTDGDGKRLGTAGASAVEETVYAGVYRALKDFATMDGGGLGGGTGGGFGGRYGHGIGGTNWHGNLGPTNVGWNLAGATPQMRADFIKKTAASLGIDPNTALRVAQSEGFYKYVGDVGNGPAYGDFQLNVGRGRMGDAFKRATHLDPADPKNWQAMDRFALEQAAKAHSWGAWFGAARVGIHGGQGIGRPPPRQEHIVIHHTMKLDGKEIARNTSYHQTRFAWMPTQAPYHDSRGHATAPDIGFFG